MYSNYNMTSRSHPDLGQLTPSLSMRYWNTTFFSFISFETRKVSTEWGNGLF